MRRLHLLRYTSLLLTIALLLCTISICIGLQPDNAYAADSDNYYASISATSGTALLGELHDLITTTHTKYTSYDDCKTTSIVITTDKGSTDDYVMDFYTHENITSEWEGGNSSGKWNREHVWCKSLSGGLWTTVDNTDKNGGTDLHHIRPVEQSLNSTRSNRLFGEVENGAEAWSKDTNKQEVAIGGHYTDKVFEPLDNVKGDVARILMYLYTHYNSYKNVGGTKNGSGNDSYYGTLNFTDIVSADSEDDAKALLLEWNKLDPVDKIETTRNEAVYAIQGNRNPFIDNSNYANLIWGDETDSSNPSEPVELTNLYISPSSFELSVGGTKTLAVTATPTKADKAVTWSSSDSSVATVSDSGIVTGIADGTATITATSTANSSIKATATVTVSKVHNFTINVGSFTMTSGYSFKEWSSGGISGIAYIYNSTSYLQFNKNQTSYYLASTTPVPGHITAVTVKSHTKATTDRPWKLLTSTEAYGQVEGKPTTGSDHREKTVTTSGVTWEVDGNDTYFALAYEQPGTSSAASYIDSIVVTYEDNVTSEGGSTTEPTLESLAISPSEVSLNVGDTQALSVTAMPSTVGNTVTWTSSNEAVATISSSGVVTALASGSTTITATSTVDTSISASITVSVTAKPATTDERVEEAEKNIIEITNELNTAKANLSQALADIETNNGSIDELNEAITNLNTAITNAESASKSYADSSDETLKTALQESIANLNTSLSNADALQQSAINTLDERLDTAEKDIDDLTTDLNTAKENLNQALENIQNNKGSIDELNEAITNLNIAIENAESASKSYADSSDNTLKTALENSIASLNTSLSGTDELQQSAIDTLNTKVASAEKDIADLTAELNTAKTNLTQALADIANNSGDISELNIAIENLKSAIGKAEDANASVGGVSKDEMNSAIQSSNAVLQSALTTLSQKLESNQQEIDDLSNEVDSTNEKLDSMNESLSTLKSTVVVISIVCAVAIMTSIISIFVRKKR